jgi:hypothetical protein
MIWWSMWRLLNGEVTTNPLFRQVIDRRRPQHTPRSDEAPISGGILIIVTLMAMIGAGVTRWSLEIWLALVILSVAFTAGAILADRVVRFTVLERERRRDILLAVTPMGTFGASWLVVMLTYRGSSILMQLRLLSRAVLIVTLLSALLIVAIGVITSPDLVTFFLPAVIPGLLLSLVLYVDFIFSTLFGALLSMLVSTYIAERFSARMLTVSVYAFVQIVIGIALLLASVNLFLAADIVMGLAAWLSLLVPLKLMTVYAVYRWVVHRLNVSPMEIQDVLRG